MKEELTNPPKHLCLEPHPDHGRRCVFYADDHEVHRAVDASNTARWDEWPRRPLIDEQAQR